MSIIRKAVGTNEFLTAYEYVRQKVNIIRNERKQQRKIQIITNPKSSFKRKISKNLNKRKINRKRKWEPKYSNNKNNHFGNNNIIII